MAWLNHLPGVTDGPQVDFSGIPLDDTGGGAATAAIIGAGWGDVIYALAGISAAMEDANLGGDPASSPGARDQNISVPAGALGFPTSTGNDVDVLRLKEGIERFLITDINNPAGSSVAQSVVWTAADPIDLGYVDEFNHVPGGSNVQYMDGHVEFVKYPGKYPVHSVFAALNFQEWF